MDVVRLHTTLLCRYLGLAGILLCLLWAFTPLADLATRWVGTRARLEPAQAIVVLASGGVGLDGALSQTSLRRVLWGVVLYRQGLAPLMVLSGGPSTGGRGEAETRAALVRGQGIPSTAILTESRGHTTHDEAVLFRRLLQPQGVRRILLVADPIDMPRAQGVFRRAGFEVLPAPTDPGHVSSPEARLGLLRHALLELLAWCYYRLAGYL